MQDSTHRTRRSPALAVEATVRDLQFHGTHLHILVEPTGGEHLRVQFDPLHNYRIEDRVYVEVAQPVIGISRNGSA